MRPSPSPTAEMQGAPGCHSAGGHPRRLPIPRFSGSLETEEQAGSLDTRKSRFRPSPVTQWARRALIEVGMDALSIILLVAIAVGLTVLLYILET